jgi:alcohol dehydrogenase (cytochrome c)
MWDYDEAGSHILIDGELAGQPRKLIAHSGRNGFFYALERSNGQTVLAKPYAGRVTWTKGIDQKTGLPVDYDPNRDIQIYSGQQNMTLTDRTKHHSRPMTTRASSSCGRSMSAPASTRRP